MKNLLRGRVRWALIFWMFVMSAIAYLDRVNISIAGSAIARDFHLDNVHLGWVFSSFVLGYALFQAPGGRLADRFGPRRIVALGVIWWGVFTALSASVPAMDGVLWVMIGVRFALGMGEAVVYPASNRLVAKWIPSNERGIANGLIFTGVGAGAAVTPPIIRYILENYGWRWSFWFSAVVGLLAGLIWYLIARDIPEEHPWVDRQERELIEAGLPQAPEQHDSHKTLPWSAIFLNKDLLAMTASYFAYGYAAYIFFTWFFHLPEHRARSQPEDQFLLRDAAVRGDGHRLVAGRLSQRPPHGTLWQTNRPLRNRGDRYRTGSRIYRPRDAGSKRAAS